MIVLAAQALRLASYALPLLMSVAGSLPTLPVERLAQQSGAVVGTVLELAARTQARMSCAGSRASTVAASADAASIGRAETASVTVATSGSAGSATASASKKSRRAAGATLEPPASDPAATRATAGERDDAPKDDPGRDGSAGEAEGTAGVGHRDDDTDRDYEWDDEDWQRGEESGGLRRSSTPDVSFGLSPVHVPAGEYHRRDIVCIGGDVTIDGEVRGDVVVVGGVLTISGSVRGDVVAVASKVHLEDTARLRHNFISVAGPVDRGTGSRIHGEFHSIDLPNLGRFATGNGLILYLLSLFLWVGIIATAFRFLAVLVVAAIAPARIEGAISAPRVSWVLAFFLGFVVHLFAGLVSLILIVGVITSPIGFALWLGVRVVVWMGLAAIYLEIGRNISRTAFGSRLSYFGSILVGFALFALIGLIPFIGWFVTAIMSSTALGLMLLTRFGGRGRQTAAAPAPALATVAPPSAPAPPPPGAAPESAR